MESDKVRANKNAKIAHKYVVKTFSQRNNLSYDWKP
jgi:hypothetical protein